MVYTTYDPLIYHIHWFNQFQRRIPTDFFSHQVQRVLVRHTTDCSLAAKPHGT